MATQQFCAWCDRRSGRWKNAPPQPTPSRESLREVELHQPEYGGPNPHNDPAYRLFVSYWNELHQLIAWYDAGMPETPAAPAPPGTVQADHTMAWGSPPRTRGSGR